MAAKKHTCIQGDSYSYKYTPKTGFELTSDWTATWAIVDKLGTGRTTLSSGSLSIDDDDAYFELEIAPSSTNIAVAEYYLIVEITNSTIGYNKEVAQEVFEVTEQGI